MYTPLSFVHLLGPGAEVFPACLGEGSFLFETASPGVVVSSNCYAIEF